MELSPPPAEGRWAAYSRYRWRISSRFPHRSLGAGVESGHSAAATILLSYRWVNVPALLSPALIGARLFEPLNDLVERDCVTLFVTLRGVGFGTPARAFPLAAGGLKGDKVEEVEDPLGRPGQG